MKMWIACVALAATGCAAQMCTEIGCNDAVVLAVDLGTLTEAATLEVRGDDGGLLTTCAFEADGSLAASGCTDGAEWTVNDDAPATLMIFGGSPEALTSVDVSRIQGDQVDEDTSDIDWGDPSYPNGEACPPECYTGQAEVTFA